MSSDMKKSKSAAGAKASTRSEEEVLAALRENLSYIMEDELDVEELLKLDAAELEKRITEMVERWKVRMIARLTKQPVTAVEEE
jgi:hypothetical protein